MIKCLLGAWLAVTPLPLLAQSAGTSTEARLQRVEDELAIGRILVDYAAFLDGRDYTRYASLFAEDGEWTNAAGTHRGPAAIRSMLQATLGPADQPNRSNYHLISNPRIDLDGDRATATSRYLFVMRGTRGQPTPSLAGIYRDELVRVDGAWKIRRRVADDIMPTPEEWRQIMASRQAQP
jgi:3-phenylpropionate/cinnamic acid dioxygenase small subunit